MKNHCRLSWIIAITAIIVFSMLGCKDESEVGVGAAFITIHNTSSYKITSVQFWGGWDGPGLEDNNGISQGESKKYEIKSEEIKPYYSGNEFNVYVYYNHPEYGRIRHTKSMWIIDGINRNYNFTDDAIILKSN